MGPTGPGIVSARVWAGTPEGRSLRFTVCSAGGSTPAWNAAALRTLKGELPSSFPDATKQLRWMPISLSGVLIVLGGWGRATEDFSNG